MSMNSSSLSQGEHQQPMLIPIHTPSSSLDDNDNDDIPEWAMLELNGELLMPQENPSPGKENPSTNRDSGSDSLIPPHHIELGSIEFVDNHPIMTLGTHQLKGRVEKLKLPFCVLEKDKQQQQQEGEHEEENHEQGTCYHVKGIVTMKLLFNNYPKSIMR